VAEEAGRHDLVVAGTISATPEQGELVQGILRTGIPTVTVALRTPFDLAAYREAGTHVCTYSILPPSMAALADALFGHQPFSGALPAAIPGLYPRGHRLRGAG
jgi:beta-N-acetylhexosaminidase